LQRLDRAGLPPEAQDRANAQRGCVVNDTDRAADDRYGGSENTRAKVREGTLAPFPAHPHNKRMSETLLDVKGMNCPLPVLRANRSLRSMAPGEKLRVLATDRAAIADFKAFCQETGHALIAMSEEAGVLSFVIRRRPDPAAPGASPPKDT
jgi:tRNA 2-thiouridine synthesizing protein A